MIQIGLRILAWMKPRLIQAAITILLEALHEWAEAKPRPA